MSRKTEASRYVNLERALYSSLPQIRAVVLEGSDTFMSLLIKRRGPGDWVVVVKREGVTGGPKVAFGAGFDFIGVLLGTEGSLAANRWRVDKPFKGVKGA